MRKTLAVVLILLCVCSVQSAHSQEPTRIVRIRIDGREVKKNWEVYFQIEGKWVKARKSSSSFSIPQELRDQKFLSILITFGKYRTQFSEVHVSKFAFDWSVGVEDKIISDEHVNPEERSEVKSLGFIDFLGSGTSAVVVDKKL
jgi:hypothetical protein